jgi:hypothetical protein
VRSFRTTGTPPAPPDTTKPSVSLKVFGARLTGRRVTLKIIAKDPSGIRKVTLKIGTGAVRTLKARTVKIRLKRAGKLALVVKVTDKAGNTRTVRRVLKVKRA